MEQAYTRVQVEFRSDGGFQPELHRHASAQILYFFALKQKAKTPYEHMMKHTVKVSRALLCDSMKTQVQIIATLCDVATHICTKKKTSECKFSPWLDLKHESD